MEEKDENDGGTCAALSCAGSAAAVRFASQMNTLERSTGNNFPVCLTDLLLFTKQGGLRQWSLPVLIKKKQGF